MSSNEFTRRAFVGLVASSALSCAETNEGVIPKAPSSVDKPVKRELVVLDRLQPVGFWARVRGSYSTFYDFKSKYRGFVVGRRSAEFRVDYDVEQTLEETTPTGYPKTIRFDVKALRVTLGRPGVRAFKRGGTKSVSLGAPGYDKSSGGQVVRFRRLDDGSVDLDVVTGALSDMERRAFQHPLGLSREVLGQRSVIPLFGSSEPQALGSSWNGDKKRALSSLRYLGFQMPEKSVSVRGCLERLEQIGPLPCQVVTGTIVGTEGTVLEFPREWQPLETNVRIEYEGIYPHNLDYPCVRETTTSSHVASALYYKDNEPVYPTATEENQATREILELR